MSNFAALVTIPSVLSTGEPNSSGSVWFLTPGTNTPVNAYSDAAATTIITQPVTLTAGGTVNRSDFPDGIYVTQDFARRLQEYTPAQAESAVSRSFGNMRRDSGFPPLRQVAQPTLRSLACNMAREDRLETDLARDVANVRSVVVWTASDPQKLPADIQKWKSSNASGWSVGACFASSRRYPNPVWWMIAVTYF